MADFVDAVGAIGQFSEQSLEHSDSVAIISKKNANTTLSFGQRLQRAFVHTVLYILYIHTHDLFICNGTTINISMTATKGRIPQSASIVCSNTWRTSLPCFISIVVLINSVFNLNEFSQGDTKLDEEVERQLNKQK